MRLTFDLVRFKWLVPAILAGALVAAIACGGDTVETVVQTVVVEREVAGETVIHVHRYVRARSRCIRAGIIWEGFLRVLLNNVLTRFLW